MGHDEEFAPERVDERVDWLFRQQDGSTLSETDLVEDLQSIYGEYVGMRDRVRERLIERIADKATIQQSSTEPQASKKQGERPSLINFEKRKHQMRGLNLYTEQRLQRLELATAVCFAVLLVGSMAWLSSLTRSLHENTASPNSLLSSKMQVPATPPKTASGVYVGGKKSVMRLNTQTGGVIWTYSIDIPNSSVAKILPANNTIYLAIADDKAMVVALDADSGKLGWSYQIPSTQLNTLNHSLDLGVQDSSVYVSAMTNNGAAVVYKLDATSGKQLAQFSLNVPSVSGIEVTKDTLYITASDGLYAFDLNGKLRWQVKMAGDGGALVMTRPHVSGGTVFTALSTVRGDGSSNTVLAAFDADTGQKRWKSQSLSGQTFDLTVTDKAIYFGTEKSDQTKSRGTLYAYDVQNGKQMWESDTVGAIEHAPAVADGVVYYSEYFPTFPEANLVFAADATTGVGKWKQGGIAARTPIRVSNGVLYVMDDSSVYALKASDGTLMWKFKPNDGVPSNQASFEVVG